MFLPPHNPIEMIEQTLPPFSLIAVVENRRDIFNQFTGHLIGDGVDHIIDGIEISVKRCSRNAGAGDDIRHRDVHIQFLRHELND